MIASNLENRFKSVGTDDVGAAAIFESLSTSDLGLKEYYFVLQSSSQMCLNLIVS